MSGTFKTTGDPLLLPVNTLTVYVSKGGNDTTGNGSVDNPYLTITKAMSSITPSSTNEYVIQLSSGTWTDNFALKAYTKVVGIDYIFTTLSGTITVNDPSWASTTGISGFTKLNMTSALTFDFTLQNPTAAVLEFHNIRNQGALTLTPNNSANQFFFSFSLFSASITQSGGQLLLRNCDFSPGNINFNSNATIAGSAIIHSTSSSANLIPTFTATQQAISITAYDSYFAGGIQASGASCTVTTDINAASNSLNTFTSGATLSTQNAYVPKVVNTTTATSINMNLGELITASGVVTYNWLNETLYDNLGLKSIDANNRYFYANDGTTVNFLYSTPGQITAFGTELYIKDIKIYETDGYSGNATLVAGTVTVSTAVVAANSRIHLTHSNTSGTLGTLYVGTIVAGTSFQIKSTSGSDTSSVNWLIIVPG